MEYRRTARRHWMFYAATNAGVVIALAALGVDINWLRASLIVAGLLLFCGGLLLIIRNWQFGSRVDFETHELIWWEGYPPSDEQSIPLDRIRSIEVAVEKNERILKIIDHEGQRIPFSSRCAPAPWELWVAKINANVPVITLRQSSSVESKPDPTVARQHSDTPADLQ